MAPHQHKSRLSQRNKPFKGGSRGASTRRKHAAAGSHTPSASSKLSSAANMNRKQKRAALAVSARARRALAAEAPPLLVLLVKIHSDASEMLSEEAGPLTLLPEYVTRELAPGQGPDTFSHKLKQLPSSVRFLHVQASRKSPSFLTQLADFAKISDHILIIPPSHDTGFTIDAAMVKVLLTTTGHSISGHPPSILPASTDFLRQLACLSLPNSALNPGNAPLRSLITRAFASYTASSVSSSWRAAIPHVLVEDFQAAQPAHGDGSVSVQLTGILRGAKMGANRLVHVSGVGSFAVEQVVAQGICVSRRDEDADDVESEGEGMDEMMREQTFPNEEDYAAERSRRVTKKKRPKGWSDYQSAWLVDDEEQASESDIESAANDVNMQDAENETSETLDEEEVDDEEGEDSEYHQKPIDEEEVERIRAAAREDVSFPDEVDMPVNHPARKRLEKFRGLKSLRTSPWDPKEMLPEDYSRIFQFADFAATKKRVLKEESAEAATDNAPFAEPGSRITLTLVGIPEEKANKMRQCFAETGALIASAMHKHTGKRTVAHARIKRAELDEAESIDVKSKDIVEIHCGFVRIQARAIYSEDNGNSSKHKMERFLQKGRFTVASFYGPALFPPAPVLIFKGRAGSGNDEAPVLIATGSLMKPDPDRIILKRIILTGYPFKIHKARVVVRFMFFNRSDIKWFKPVELWTKYGRTGRILEPLGTHGYMKCLFDSPLAHHDTVCMSLYKRVYPKRAD